MSTSDTSPHIVVTTALSTSTVSAMTGSGRCKAPNNVIQRKPHTRTRKLLILFRKQGLRVCMPNMRTLNFTGAATLLDQEMQKWNIQLAGVEEVRWLGSCETTVGDITFFWSGREDNRCQQGVALAVSRKVMSACVSSTPINERLLRPRFKRSAGHLCLHFI